MAEMAPHLHTEQLADILDSSTQVSKFLVSMAVQEYPHDGTLIPSFLSFVLIIVQTGTPSQYVTSTAWWWNFKLNL